MSIYFVHLGRVWARPGSAITVWPLCVELYQSQNYMSVTLITKQVRLHGWNCDDVWPELPTLMDYYESTGKHDLFFSAHLTREMGDFGMAELLSNAAWSKHQCDVEDRLNKREYYDYLYGLWKATDSVLRRERKIPHSRLPGLSDDILELATDESKLPVVRMCEAGASYKPVPLHQALQSVSESRTCSAYPITSGG
jgi:hypothetical protein